VEEPIPEGTCLVLIVTFAEEAAALLEY